MNHRIEVPLFSSFNPTQRLRRRCARVRLVACDLDGTLLNENNTIGERTREAIRALQEVGTEILLASGRSAGFVGHFARLVGSPYAVISLNGALTSDGKGTLLEIVPVKAETGMLILGLAERYANVSVSLFTAEGILTHTPPHRLPRYLGAYPAEQVVISDPLPYIERTAMYVLCGPYSALQEISVRIARETKGRIDRIFYQSKSSTDHYYLEVKSWGVNKGGAVRSLARALGLKRSEIAAIGDYANDLEMCRYAGISIAMRNAIDELKRKADFVTRGTYREEGAAEFLEFLVKARRGVKG
ncbi:MAG: HAD family hydrolase [Bacteroidota bacterium]|nr:HAD family hydrolase [Bacteroidota bacterium]